MSFNQRQILPNYTMVWKAGEGGFATAFVIKDIVTSTPHILKLSKKPIQNEEKVLKEFKLQSSLNHPNVV